MHKTAASLQLAMSRYKQCPVCFGELAVRPVQPCFVCGGSSQIPPSKPDQHFTLRDDGTSLTLCTVCWIEEVLSDQGDLKNRIRIKSNRDLLVVPDKPTPLYDKFCPACNHRLALLEIMAHRLSDEELENWRRKNSRS